jgi:hypothetical protein
VEHDASVVQLLGQVATSPEQTYAPQPGARPPFPGGSRLHSPSRPLWLQDWQVPPQA